jgi:hypothetical protein
LAARVTLAGVIAIDVRSDGTVTELTLDRTDPRVAVIEMALALPVKSVAKPVLPMLTTVGFDDAQVTAEVMLAVEPSL